MSVFTVGCHQAATSSEHANGGAVQPDEEETPITAADVPVPASYGEAVQRLEQYRDEVKQAVSSGKLHDAHRPLDETNIALERLPGIARASGVPPRDWETVVVAGDDLGEALAVIHERIDAGQSPNYATHSAAIDDALGRLRAVAGQQGAENHKRAENEKRMKNE
ncbi:MAG TPA: hypothetical protein VFI31_13270 [Pirellulales bacterium]|nr:hypothetical protein [Pirellulales bacterium]